MSPRAAWRLESLGFQHVYDYANGKVDWIAAGCRTEGSGAAEPRVGARARRDVPRARLDERLGDVSARAAATGWRMAVVVNDAGIVLGVIEGSRFDGDPDALVAGVMRPGPSTYRAHVPTREMADSLTKGGLHRAIISTPDGELIGVVFLEDLA